MGSRNGSFFNGSSSHYNVISLEKNVNLVLLPFWNLYESLMYSNTTIPKFKSWHDTGKQKINKLIAKIGIPL